MASLDGKQMYANMLDYYDKLNDQFDFNEVLKGNTLKDLFRADIAKFLMYLSASDGVIAQDEVDFILEFLDEVGFFLTRESLSEFIDEHDIYTKAFETSAPLILQLTVMMDNKFNEDGKSVDPSVSELLCDTFKTVGLNFIKCDGDIDEQEMSDWETYVNTLDSFVKANHYKFKNDDDVAGAVDAPTKA